MIPRSATSRLQRALDTAPVAALLGPRQVGKTTLAIALGEARPGPSVYLDLERDSDRAKLADAELYLARQAGKLVILDEIQRRSGLFPLLRSLVDERIRGGERAGQFLALGSASRDLLRQSSESLAGRISYLELTPFTLGELSRGLGGEPLDQTWLRGGFPGSVLAVDEATSWEWRGQFISTYLERDIPLLGPRLPAEQMRRLWMMLAHGQGTLLNAARLASGLGVSGKTVRHYIDVLSDLYMVRQLQPWSGNSTKRLTRSPKVYVRDSGLLHRLANIPDEDTLLGHPLCGASWEGFVLEQILGNLADTWRPSFYRTSAGAEIDLVLEGVGGAVLAVEIKRTLAPRPSRGFVSGCADIGATGRYHVTPADDRFPIGSDTVAIGLSELLELL